MPYILCIQYQSVNCSSSVLRCILTATTHTTTSAASCRYNCQQHLSSQQLCPSHLVSTPQIDTGVWGRLRPSVADLSTRRPVFNYRSAYVGFLAKWQWDTFVSGILMFPLPLSSHHCSLFVHSTSHPRYITLATYSIVKKATREDTNVTSCMLLQYTTSRERAVHSSVSAVSACQHSDTCISGVHPGTYRRHCQGLNSTLLT